MRSVYTSKIISSHRDLVALVFYGTEQSKNPSNSFKHVYVYHNLDEPGKLLKLLCSSSFDKTQNISTFLKWLQFQSKAGKDCSNAEKKLEPIYLIFFVKQNTVLSSSPSGFLLRSRSSTLLIFHRCKAGTGSGCSAWGKRCPVDGKDHGQWGDVTGWCPVVLRQPLQWHQASPLVQETHDLHLQGWTTRGRHSKGPTGSHQGQWPERNW